jgi:hypothetical protein
VILGGEAIIVISALRYSARMAPLSARSWKSSKIDPSSIGAFRIRCRLSYVQTMPSGCLLITLPFRVILISFVFIADVSLPFRMEHCTEFRIACIESRADDWSQGAAPLRHHLHASGRQIRRRQCPATSAENPKQPADRSAQITLSGTTKQLASICHRT